MEGISASPLKARPSKENSSALGRQERGVRAADARSHLVGFLVDIRGIGRDILG
jgi:hypothetical protein